MTVHIVKLSVGTDGIEDLARWQKLRLKETARQFGEAKLFHTTRMVPKRQADVLDNGSIYWVIRGAIQVRQRVIGFEDAQRADGAACCRILLEPTLVPVRITPRRAFQGWRYLDVDDAPPDLAGTIADNLAAMPPKMRRDLAELCLL